MNAGLNERCQQIASELVNGLRDLYGHRLREALVFGSHARGDAEDGSDLDVALVLDAFDDPSRELEYTAELVTSLSLRHGLVIALFPIRLQDWVERRSPLLLNIRREGVRIR